MPPSARYAGHAPQVCRSRYGKGKRFKASLGSLSWHQSRGNRRLRHFDHLYELASEDITWITRAKGNMVYRVAKKRQQPSAHGKVLRDDEIILKTPKSRTAYPERLRRVVARVIVNDEEKIMVFITNNMKLAASSICDALQKPLGN